MTAEEQCEYISWNRFYRLCAILHERIVATGFRPDIIVAIARGGYMPGRVLADFFDLMDLAAVKIEHYHGLRKSRQAVVRHPLRADITDRHVLVVDDVSDSGDSFEAALRHINECGDPASLRTAVLHHKQTSSYVPDFYATRVLRWRWIIYPWAVTEDLGVLLGDISPRLRTIPEVRQFLRSRHGLVLPVGVLKLVADKIGIAR